MNMLMILIPIALGLGALGLGAFLWNLRSGQYEDLEGAGFRILDDAVEDQQEDSLPQRQEY
jgi:cbb3-type cytochrome oxidase maturation protein